MHLLVACLLAVVIICVLFSFFLKFWSSCKIGANRYLYFEFFIFSTFVRQSGNIALQYLLEAQYLISCLTITLTKPTFLGKHFPHPLYSEQKWHYLQLRNIITSWGPAMGSACTYSTF